MTEFTLTILDQNLSSWSLRPWLLMKQAAISFATEKVLFKQPDFKEVLLARSPAGLAPVLTHNGLAVWDSLAICEYLAELFPEKNLWPQDPAARALARSVSAEMHSGFAAVRSTMPMNICARMEGFVPMRPAKPEIARITSIWADLRRRHGEAGPFLFGGFTIADAMYAPVVTRFNTYGVALEGEARVYADHILSLPALQEWEKGARAEVNAQVK